MKGSKFKDILEDSELEEGKLYNLIMRLYILCEEIKNFFEELGNPKHAEKYVKARELIIRDILSCKSLYVQDIDFDI